MKNEQNQIVLILGRKFTGKTTLMNKLIKSVKGKKSVLIVDKLIFSSLLSNLGSIENPYFVQKESSLDKRALTVRHLE